MGSEGHAASLQFSLLGHKSMRSFKVKTLSLAEGMATEGWAITRGWILLCKYLSAPYKDLTIPETYPIHHSWKGSKDNGWFNKSAPEMSRSLKAQWLRTQVDESDTPGFPSSWSYHPGLTSQLPPLWFGNNNHKGCNNHCRKLLHHHNTTKPRCAKLKIKQNNLARSRTSSASLVWWV